MFSDISFLYNRGYKAIQFPPASVLRIGFFFEPVGCSDHTDINIDTKQTFIQQLKETGACSECDQKREIEKNLCL